jgi:hypothetical protein
MSLLGLILGAVAQLTFALFQFMSVVFSAAGLANGGDLSAAQTRILEAAMFGLPGASVAVVAWTGALYALDSEYQSGWWHAVPVVLFVAYVLYAVSLAE